MTKLIEKEDVEREYGFLGVNAIIDHMEYGRIFIADVFGGIGSLQGGKVRWQHGIAVKLQEGDTLESLKKLAWNDYTTGFDAMINGYDDRRPVLNWSGHEVRSLAKAAGL